MLPALRRRKAALLWAFMAGLVFLVQDAAVLDQWLEDATFGDDDYCHSLGGAPAPDSDNGLACAQHCLRYHLQRYMGLGPKRPELAALRWIETGWASTIPPSQERPTVATRYAALPRGPPQVAA